MHPSIGMHLLLCESIRESEKSIGFSDALITGFGHVGKILGDRIKPLFRSVTVAARSDKDIYYAKALGFDIIGITPIEEL